MSEERGDYVVILLVDPTELDDFRNPTIRKAIHVLTNRPYLHLINDFRRPGSIVLAEGITEVQLFPFGQSLIKGREAYEEYNCALCGGRISRKACQGCGVKFNQIQVSHFFLPIQIVELLRRSGFVFKNKPDDARSREREIWERTYGFSRLVRD